MKDKRLRKILLIKDLDNEDIFGIIGRMEVLLDYFKKKEKYNNLIPFLETYYLVSKSVAEKNTKYYTNYKDLEKMDVYFASLYFKPLLTYLETGKCSKPWQNYFKYCKEDGIPFVQMILGINAHINADLLMSLNKLNYKNRKDFFVINKILKEVTPKVMKFLAFEEHDVFGIGGLVFKKFVNQEFKNVIFNWRTKSWENSRYLSSKKKSITKEESKIYDQTENISLEIIKIFEDLSIFKNISEVSKKLHNLNVKIK